MTINLSEEESPPRKGNKIKSRKNLTIKLITNLYKEIIFLEDFSHGAKKV